MAASIEAEKLLLWLKSSKCLVLFSLCYFSSFLFAEEVISESMLALSFVMLSFLQGMV